MADFAATYFSRKALSWHSRLPQSVRGDWSKLEIALLARWPPPADADRPRIEPTPAAAPPQEFNGEARSSLYGVLKVVLDQSNTSYYVNFADGSFVFFMAGDSVDPTNAHYTERDY
ncbi:hypothetical protein FRC00_006908 [Tulasnella sp. 408]|nr:hypothetical protein FRC00_006908 [Tulasnella sp. 408]